MAQPTIKGHVKRKADALKGVAPEAEDAEKKVSAGGNLLQAFKNPDDMQDSALKNIIGAFKGAFGKKDNLDARKSEGVLSRLPGQG